MMKKIEKYLDLTRPTVTGKTVGENLAKVKPVDSDVIRSLDNPVWREGALAILKGNLAPRGAVTRHTVVDNKELLDAEFTARVFDTTAEVMEAIHGRTDQTPGRDRLPLPGAEGRTGHDGVPWHHHRPEIPKR